MLCQDSFRSYIHVELIFIVLRAINRSKCHNFMSMQICKCNGPLRPRAYGGRGAGASVFLRMQERSADISQRSFDIENRHFIFRKIIDDFIEPCILFSALLHLGHPSTESVMHDDDEARPNSQNFQGVMNQGLQNPREIVGRMVRFLTGHAFLQNAIVFHGIAPPPGDISCRLCEDIFSDETPHHIITECDRLCMWRGETLGAYILDEFPEWDVLSLRKFLNHKLIILLETE